MTNFFTPKFLKTALAVSLLAGVGSQGMAQGTSHPFRSGKSISRPIANQGGSHAKVNTLVSKPGNSQDFTALGSGNWQLESKSAYTYDVQGRLIQRLYTNPVTNQNLEREITVYDAKGNETESRTEQWNGTVWEITDAYKSQITYNVHGQKTEIIYQYWSPAMNAWINAGREQTSYDANNLATSITNSEWDSSSSNWELMDRMVLSNVGGTATSAIIQEHNGTAWKDVYRAQNLTWHVLYDIPSAYVLEYFDNNTWIKEEKYAAVYDAKGGHIGIYEQWTGATWEKSTRETESFDNNRNYTGWLDENWNPMNNTWDFDSEDREVLTYAGIDVTQRVYQDSFNPANTLEDRSKEVYSNFQTFTISGVKNLLAETAINVFPNPATDVVTISFPENKGTALTATLADVTGKTWISKSFKAEEATSLNMEALPKGIYFLQLQTEAGSTVKRIVKQ